jgi:hypothetical protein
MSAFLLFWAQIQEIHNAVADDSFRRELCNCSV